VERRLAAIMAADAVGYSRMMSEDESGVLALLQKHRSEVIDPTIEKHHGRTIKLMGDGLLAEFSSVVEAVTCAAEIQRAMGARNAGGNAGRQMAFRIGVHLGDVIVDHDDLYGDGVNIAARLEGIVPTLVLHAREDAMAPFEAGRQMAAGISGARFVALQSKNHVPLEQDPATRRLFEELDLFLK